MPPVDVRCPCSPGEKRSLQHWRGECILPAMVQGWYEGQLQGVLNDSVHCDGAITVTRVLSCPRKALLADFVPYTFNPLATHKATLGTLVHRFAQAHLPPGVVAEVRVRGRLWGVEMEAGIDSLGGGAISEAKFHGNEKMQGMLGRRKWNPGTVRLVEDDLVAQVNMQRMLLAQRNPKLTPEKDRLVNKLQVSHSSDSEPTWPSDSLPLRDEEWCGAVQPCGGGYQAKHIAGFLQQAVEQIRGGRPAVEAIAEVPMVGKTMWRDKAGKSMCEKWCEYRDVCPGYSL